MEVGKRFADRKEAGLVLGKVLLEDYKNNNPLVLGIPRGGVEVGYYVAGILDGEFTAIITKKLSMPLQEELAIGAVSEDGTYYLLDSGEAVEKVRIEKIIKEEYREVRKRIELYRNGEELPDLKDRTVIIVDDGIATGATMVPALQLCKNHDAESVVLAAPVSGRRFVSEIKELADDIRILLQPENFYAVGQVYRDFYNLTDHELIKLLEDHKRDGKIFRQTISSESD